MKADKRHLSVTGMADIAAHSDAGMTYAKIGKLYGISAEQARNAHIKYIHIRRRLTSGNPLELLSVRPRNALMGRNLRTAAEVAREFRQTGLKGISNLGAKSIKEIETWLESQGCAVPSSAPSPPVTKPTTREAVSQQDRALNEAEALQLLEEITTRMLHKRGNANGGDCASGGIYWRLCALLRFVDARLADDEGEQHAEFVRATHGRLVVDKQ